MPNTDAQRAANRRYQARHRYFQVRVDPDLAEAVQAHAASTGETIQAMLLRLLQAELDRTD